MSALDDLLKKAQKKYNISAGPMGSIIQDVEFISTGNIALDYMIGGGIPLKRSVELAGASSSGKTTTALQTAATLQKIIKSGGDAAKGITKNDKIIYLDYEQAMDPEYARALGLDVDHDSFIFAQPGVLEEGLDFLSEALKTNEVRLAIIDSVAAMVPSVQAEADSIGNSQPAIVARLLKKFGQNLNPILAEHNATVIFINHETEKLQMGGRPGVTVTTTPGGVALKYFASVRLSYRFLKQNKGPYTDPTTKETSEIITSTDVKVKTVKNKVAPPYREAVVRVRFGKGFDNFWTAMQILLANKYVMHSTGMYYFHKVVDEGLAPEWMPRATTGMNRPYIKGNAKLFEIADANPEWRNAVISLAEKVAAENWDNAGKIVKQNEVEEEVDEEESDVVESESLKNELFSE